MQKKRSGFKLNLTSSGCVFQIILKGFEFDLSLTICIPPCLFLWYEVALCDPYSNIIQISRSIFACEIADQNWEFEARSSACWSEEAGASLQEWFDIANNWQRGIKMVMKGIVHITLCQIWRFFLYNDTARDGPKMLWFPSVNTISCSFYWLCLIDCVLSISHKP